MFFRFSHHGFWGENFSDITALDCNGVRLPRLAMTKYWLKLVKFLLPKRVFPSTHMDMTNLFRVSFWPSVSICPVRTCGSHWWCIVARCATPHVSRPALEPFFTHSTLKVGGAVLLWSEWPMARGDYHSHAHRRCSRTSIVQCCCVGKPGGVEINGFCWVLVMGGGDSL